MRPGIVLVLACYLVTGALISAVTADTCPQCIDYGTDPADAIVGTLDVTDDPVDVEVRGNRVYLVTNNAYFPEEPPVHELVIVDVSDPAAPTQLGAVDSPWGQSSLDVQGSFAYVAGPSLAKIDVSDPTAPLLVGQFDFAHLPGETAKSVDVDGDRAYVISDVAGGSQDRIRIFDVSADDPVPLGSVVFSYPINALVARGSYVYGAGYFGLWMVDVSDPVSPTVVANLGLENQGVDIDLLGDVAVVAVLERPSAVIDVSDPAAPQLITQGPTMARFEASGNLIYDAFASGLRVLDFSDPSMPEVVGTASGIFAFFLDVDGCHVATVNQFLGEELRMVPVQCAAAASVSPGQAASRARAEAVGAPNPFGNTTTLRFDLDGSQQARIVIYDITGRLVRELPMAAASSTRGSALWDGRDQRQRRVAPGTYVYRVVTPGGSLTGRVTLID